MEVVICNDTEKYNIISKRIIHENGEVIKYSPNSESKLMYLNFLKENLDTNHLAMQIREYRDTNGKHLAHAMIDYVEYEVLAKCLNDKCLDKQYIFLEIWKVLENLLNNGIVYSDIHHENILIKSGIDFKLVDLDEVSLEKSVKNIYEMIYNFVDLLVEAYIYCDTNKMYTYFNTMYNQIDVKKHFDKEAAEMLKLVYEKDDEAIKIDVPKLIKSFKDEERNKYITKTIFRR